jgi:hypothetical protein
MKQFARAITTGFALALGAALFRKVSKKIGLDDKPKAAEPEVQNSAAVASKTADEPAPAQ